MPQNFIKRSLEENPHLISKLNTRTFVNLFEFIHCKLPVTRKIY